MALRIRIGYEHPDSLLAYPDAHNLSKWGARQKTVEARSRFSPNARSVQLAQDVLRAADLPYLRDKNVRELLRRHILR